jgi:hypothetical protein
MSARADLSIPKHEKQKAAIKLVAAFIIWILCQSYSALAVIYVLMRPRMPYYVCVRFQEHRQYEAIAAVGLDQH